MIDFPVSEWSLYSSSIEVLNIHSEDAARRLVFIVSPPPSPSIPPPELSYLPSKVQKYSRNHSHGNLRQLGQQRQTSEDQRVHAETCESRLVEGLDLVWLPCTFWERGWPECCHLPNVVQALPRPREREEGTGRGAGAESDDFLKIWGRRGKSGF